MYSKFEFNTFFL